MSIVEYINERNEMYRLDFWNDGKAEVVKTHGMSIMYMLKAQQIQKALGCDAIEAYRRTDTWMKAEAQFRGVHYDSKRARLPNP